MLNLPSLNLVLIKILTNGILADPSDYILNTSVDLKEARTSVTTAKLLFLVTEHEQPILFFKCNLICNGKISNKPV